MSNQANKEWHQFEELIADLHKRFHPGARITRNEKLPGQNSERKREIDICIRQRVGIQDLLIVVDCKKRSRKVDLPEMHSFIGLKDDVGAHSGVLVSEKGFSKPALRLAKRGGVQTLTFRDTKTQNWPKDLLVQVGLDLRVMIPIRLTFQATDKPEVAVNPKEFRVRDQKSGIEVSLKELFEREWFDDKDEPQPGSWERQYDSFDDNKQPIGTLRVSFVIQKRRYKSRVGLEFVGLIDNQSNIAHVNSAAWPEIQLSNIEKNWTRLKEEEPLPAGFLIMVLKTAWNGRLQDGEIVPDFPPLALNLSMETKPSTPISLSTASVIPKVHIEPSSQQ